MSSKPEPIGEKTDHADTLAVVDEAVPQHGQIDPALFIDPKVEKKLVRRIDAYLISFMGLLYLMCFLDRANIGAANVATPSISTALGMSPTQYGAVVSVVYATYVVFEPVWANLLKIMSPKVLLSFSTLVWGTLTLATAWATTYEHLIAIRVLLGAFEAGLFPCITIIVMMTYRREETGRRMSYLFSCAAFAGAFGGLIGFGLVRIETGSIVGWQYLYIVEGALTLLLAPITFFWIPNRLDQAWFLNAHQKELAAKRYEINKRHYNDADTFRWTEVWNAMKDWRVYSSGTIQFCADITLYGISTFMPQIIRSMGFSNVNAQLLTVPVYLVGATVFMICAYYSDKIQVRSYFIIFGMSLNLIGFIMLATIESVGGRYFALYVVASGLYITPGLNVTWISNNLAPHYRRATGVGLNQLIGNSSGAAIGSIFLSTLAPRYLRSMYIAIGLTALGIALTVLQLVVYKRINKKREQLIADGAPDMPELGDANPHFMYWI